MPWPYKLDKFGVSKDRNRVIDLAYECYAYESPFPDGDFLIADERFKRMFNNIKINYSQSSELLHKFLDEFAPYWCPIDYDNGLNYCNNTKINLSYPEYDAYILDSMMAHFRPARILEFGSGYSTKAMLDALSKWEINSQITCVDRFADSKVKSYLTKSSVNFLDQDIVQIDSAEISKLEKNDILFIDSSHVLKNFGDVESIYINIIPNLKPGVIVHVHDIFLPENYPALWLIDWKSVLTEQHLLAVYLHNRKDIKILSANYYNLINDLYIPEHLSNKSGGSFWFTME